MGPAEATGWRHVPGALAPGLVERLERWIDEVVGWASRGGPGLHHHELTAAGPVPARSERLIEHHEELREFVVAGPPLELASEVLAAPAILFKEKVNYKHPGGGGFAPHQDATAYRMVDRHVSVMVPIDPATPASGCLFVAPTVPEILPNERGRIDDAVVRSLDWRAVEVEPGDMVAFDSLVPHHSGPNTTDRSRRALYLTYNAASLGDHRAAYYADKEAEFAREGASFDGNRVRLSINDDFLGRPVS